VLARISTQSRKLGTQQGVPTMVQETVQADGCRQVIVGTTQLRDKVRRKKTCYFFKDSNIDPTYYLTIGYEIFNKISVRNTGQVIVKSIVEEMLIMMSVMYGINHARTVLKPEAYWLLLAVNGGVES